MSPRCARQHRTRSTGSTPTSSGTSAELQNGLRVFSALLPAVLYSAGALLFMRFRLTQREHARVRAELDARARG